MLRKNKALIATLGLVAALAVTAGAGSGAQAQPAPAPAAVTDDEPTAEDIAAATTDALKITLPGPNLREKSAATTAAVDAARRVTERLRLTPGSRLSSLGVDLDGKIVLTLDPSLAGSRLETIVRRVFGEKLGRVGIARYSATGMYDDSSPFIGGSHIRQLYYNGSPEGQCTTGIPWRTSGNRGAIITAAHCINIYDSFTNGLYSLNDTFTASASWTAPYHIDTVQRSYNTTTQTSLTPGAGWGTGTALWTSKIVSSSPRGDLAMITVQSNKAVRGQFSANPTTTYDVSGSLTADPGESVCFSGARSQSTECGLIVDGLDLDVYTSNGVYAWRGMTTTHMTTNNPYNYHCPIEGDSGGPVWQGVNGHTMVGIVSGSSPTSEYGTCAMAFTPITDATLMFGGSIVTDHAQVNG